MNDIQFVLCIVANIEKLSSKGPSQGYFLNPKNWIFWKSNSSVWDGGHPIFHIVLKSSFSVADSIQQFNLINNVSWFQQLTRSRDFPILPPLKKQLLINITYVHPDVAKVEGAANYVKGEVRRYGSY